MNPLPDPFVALQAAVDGLDAFLKLQTYDLSPVLLTQPPSNRDARRERLAEALQPLDLQLEAIKQLHERIGLIHSAILGRRSMGYSAIHPISAIPPEILRVIFSYVPAKDKGDASTARTLSYVSKDWRQVVRGYRRIWNSETIAGSYDFPALKMPLALSGQEDFHLVVQNPPPKPRYVPSITERNLLRTRLSSLSWKRGTPSEDPSCFLRSLAGNKQVVLPSLRQLHVDMSPPERFSGHRFEFYRLKVPRLVHLELSGIDSPDMGSVVHQLKHLVLRDMTLDFQGLQTLLRRAIKLQNLWLYNIRGGYNGASHFSAETTIHLKSLQTLSLEDIDKGAAAVVLGFASIPNLRVFTYTHNPTSNAGTYDDSIGTPWHHLPSQNPDLQRVTVPNLLYKTISSAHGLEKLDLTLPHYALKAAISALLQRPKNASASSRLRLVTLDITDSLYDYNPLDPHYHAHSGEVASALADLFLDAVKLHASLGAHFEEIRISRCMGADKFLKWAESVDVLWCHCPATYLGWQDEMDTESDSAEEEGDPEEQD